MGDSGDDVDRGVDAGDGRGRSVHGDPEGNFFALDARTGARLWSFQTGGWHRGSAVTYAIGGRQYVATPSGWGSILGRAQGALWPQALAPRAGSALFVFALPEDRK